jgi:hypothetical protein
MLGGCCGIGCKGEGMVRRYGPGMAVDFTAGLRAARSPIAVRQLALFHHPVVSY